MNNKTLSRSRIHKRIRKKVSGSAEKPRLAVNRSNRYISCQLIDDVAGVTITGVSARELKASGTKIEQAAKVGKLIAEKAAAMNIDQVVFDRGGYLYHGRVKALADGAREGGLKF